MTIKTPIARPEWLNDGLKNAGKVFTLSAAGRIPESILGWMIVTACLRVLRSVYGSDLETAAAIRKIVLDEEARALKPVIRCPRCGESKDDALGCLCEMDGM